MSRIVVTGATGLVGRHLVHALVRRGDDVRALSRGARTIAGATAVRWDPLAEPLPKAALDGADAIVNLAGEPIGAGRWTEARRRQILESRLLVTRRCVDALVPHGIGILVSASAIGYYGSTEAPVDETAAPGNDFLATVCTRWEAAASQGDAVARVVRLRTGIVLARDGGALPRLLLVARLGAAGPLGSGRQWLSWIHVADEVGALLACIDNDSVRGPVNAVAPEPVRQRELSKRLARLVHRPSVLPAPAIALRLALGEMANLVLLGQQVVPTALTDAQYHWQFTTIHAALDDLAGAGAPTPTR